MGDHSTQWSAELWATRDFLTEAVPLCRECEDEQSGTRGQQHLAFNGRPQQVAASSGMGRHAFYRAHKLQRLAAF
jgi:hypothetical protein